jgi:hypothetical protein
MPMVALLHGKGSSLPAEPVTPVIVFVTGSRMPPNAMNFGVVYSNEPPMKNLPFDKPANESMAEFCVP